MQATLKQKIGQMLLIGFRGLDVQENDWIAQDIRERHLGGVVLFDYDMQTRAPLRNIAHPEQVRRLTASLQNSAAETLLIGIDQEGGKVNRLKERFGFPPSVSAQYLGELDQSEETKKWAMLTAGTLTRLGMNLNFAPVVDLNVFAENPIIGGVERSFSANPDVVIRHARQWIACHQRQGVLCALKHFPGHGSSRGDTHLGFVDVGDSWSPDELKPYQALLREGFHDMVMTAHIFNARLDPDFPATLSRKIIHKLLREELGFKGVVVSDDMQMRAITAHYDFADAIRLAIEAGVDILTFGNNLTYDEHIVERAVAVICKLLADGKVSEERIETSYRRICRLKSHLRLSNIAIEKNVV